MIAPRAKDETEVLPLTDALTSGTGATLTHTEGFFHWVLVFMNIWTSQETQPFHALAASCLLSVSPRIFLSTTFYWPRHSHLSSSTSLSTQLPQLSEKLCGSSGPGGGRQGWADCLHNLATLGRSKIGARDWACSTLSIHCWIGMGMGKRNKVVERL